MQGIILAAGIGKRMQGKLNDLPKSFIKINKKTLIERMIDNMIEAGFNRIVIVVGFQKEKFDYLKEYSSIIEIVIVYNEDYYLTNTITSIYAAREYLTMETYITTADIFVSTNLFLKYREDRNFYLLKKKRKFEKEEWTADLDREGRIRRVNTKSFYGNSYVGISHWSTTMVKEILVRMNEIDINLYKNCYWDEILLSDYDKYEIYGFIVDDEVFEFDDYNDITCVIKNKLLDVDI